MTICLAALLSLHCSFVLLRSNARSPCSLNETETEVTAIRPASHRRIRCRRKQDPCDMHAGQLILRSTHIGPFPTRRVVLLLQESVAKCFTLLIFTCLAHRP
jgi:hypothetical protein